MTQVDFTLNKEEVQSIIEHSLKEDVSKNILTTVFNQLMEKQRTEYIQADDYEQSKSRQSQRNGYYDRDFTTRIGFDYLKKRGLQGTEHTRKGLAAAIRKSFTNASWQRCQVHF